MAIRTTSAPDALNRVIFSRRSDSDTSGLFRTTNGSPIIITVYGNMNPTARIWIEQVFVSQKIPSYFKDGCHCCLVPGIDGEFLNITKIPCATFDHDMYGEERPRYLRITSHNPTVQINLPPDTYFQLRWEGVGFPGDETSTPEEREVIVTWSLKSNSDSKPYSYGCPEVTFTEDPTAVTPTGVIRCVEPDLDPTHPTIPPRRDVVEEQIAKAFVYEDGQHETTVVWREKKPITWIDTGVTREYCNVGTAASDIITGDNPPAIPDVPGSLPAAGLTVDTSFEKQQVSDCGDTRWVQSDCMWWRRTGVTRMRMDGAGVEAQEVNQFGRLRWRPLPVKIAPIAINPDDPWTWIPHWTVPDGVQDRAEGTINRAEFTLNSAVGTITRGEYAINQAEYTAIAQAAYVLSASQDTNVPVLNMKLPALAITVPELEGSLDNNPTDVPALEGTLPAFVGRFPGYESVDTLMARRHDRFNIFVSERCYAFANNVDEPAATVPITAQAPGTGGTAYIYPTPRPDATVAVWSRPIPDDHTSPSMIVGYARRDPLGQQLQAGVISSPGA